jgi:hypothetical protein
MIGPERSAAHLLDCGMIGYGARRRNYWLSEHFTAAASIFHASRFSCWAACQEMCPKRAAWENVAVGEIGTAAPDHGYA